MTVINTADAVYLGGAGVSAVYAGTDKVWPPPVPDPPKMESRTFGAANSGNAFTSGSIAVPMPSGLQAGDLILCVIGAGKNATTPNVSFPGFTLLAYQWQVSGTSAGYVCIFGKIATGSEGTTTFTVGSSGTSQISYICERWSGVGGLPAVGPSGSGYISGGTFTMTAPQMTTTVANSVVYTAAGGRGPNNGELSPSWGGGAVALHAAPTNNIGFAYNASQVLGVAGPTQHSLTISNTQGAPSSNIVSIVIPSKATTGGTTPTGPVVPSYVPAGHEDKYDTTVGTFNFHSGNTTRLANLVNSGSSLQEHIFLGDSVGEGWTALSGVSVTADRLNAFPIKYRDKVAERLSIPIAGDGHVRTRSIQFLTTHYKDDRWTGTNVPLNWTNNVHYVSAGSVNTTATFSSDRAGTNLDIYCIDKADIKIRIDGGSDIILPGGGTGNPRTHTISGLPNTKHSVVISPAVPSGQISIYGANVYNNTGLIIHNVSQGGSKVRTSATGQDVWSDTSSGVNNMLPSYSHPDLHGNVDVVFIELGGNDSQNEPVDYTGIQQGYEKLAAAFPNSDIVLLMVAAGGSGFNSDYNRIWTETLQTALNNDWPVIDTQFILGGYDNMAANGYVGDSYGHLNVAGATYLGNAVAEAVLAGTGLAE